MLSAFSLNTALPGEKAVATMYNQWKGKWYQNFVFEQKAIFYNNGKVVRTDVWQEVLSSPGNLHIRFNGFETNNGVIYVNDSVYTFQSGVLKTKKRETNFLALLGFDIYFNEPQITAMKLSEMGYDLRKIYNIRFRNSDVMVVGTDNPADTSSSQFWIDTKNQWVIRAIKNNAGAVRDVHFNDYRQIDNHWVATEMVFKNPVDTVFVERYFNMKFPEHIPAEVFDPVKFKDARW
ncbi:MAG TPA: hypothetical protein VGE26_06890 [Sphingobacteriaceae bacterium]